MIRRFKWEADEAKVFVYEQAQKTAVSFLALPPLAGVKYALREYTQKTILWAFLYSFYLNRLDFYYLFIF